MTSASVSALVTMVKRAPSLSTSRTRSPSSIRSILVSVCTCDRPKVGLVPLRTQYLRGRLFPSSLSNPRAAFTLDVLDLFAKVAVQGQVAAYNFYQTMRNITPLGRIVDLPVSVTPRNMSCRLTSDYRSAMTSSRMHLVFIAISSCARELAVPTIPPV